MVYLVGRALAFEPGGRRRGFESRHIQGRFSENDFFMQEKSFLIIAENLRFRYVVKNLTIAHIILIGIVVICALRLDAKLWEACIPHVESGNKVICSQGIQIPL